VRFWAIFYSKDWIRRIFSKLYCTIWLSYLLIIGIPVYCLKNCRSIPRGIIR